MAKFTKSGIATRFFEIVQNAIQKMLFAFLSIKTGQFLPENVDINFVAHLNVEWNPGFESIMFNCDFSNFDNDTFRKEKYIFKDVNRKYRFVEKRQSARKKGAIGMMCAPNPGHHYL